jgi:hypothetical protein
MLHIAQKGAIISTFEECFEKGENHAKKYTTDLRICNFRKYFHEASMLFIRILWILLRQIEILLHEA